MMMKIQLVVFFTSFDSFLQFFYLLQLQLQCRQLVQVQALLSELLSPPAVTMFLPLEEHSCYFRFELSL